MKVPANLLNDKVAGYQRRVLPEHNIGSNEME
jgi:hypothetical protein